MREEGREERGSREGRQALLTGPRRAPVEREEERERERKNRRGRERDEYL